MTEKITKTHIFNIPIVALLGALCYAILVTSLGYFSINYQLDFLKDSFLFKTYFYLDNSFGGYIITGMWAFFDIATLMIIFFSIYLLADKILVSIDKNA